MSLGRPVPQAPAFCFFTERFERYRPADRLTAANWIMHVSDIFQWMKPDGGSFHLTEIFWTKVWTKLTDTG